MCTFFLISTAQAINTARTGFTVRQGKEDAVDAHSVCKKVLNRSTQEVFVPTGTANEWSTFRSNLPMGVSLSDCTVTVQIDWHVNSDYQNYKISGGSYSNHTLDWINAGGGCNETRYTFFYNNGWGGPYFGTVCDQNRVKILQLEPNTNYTISEKKGDYGINNLYINCQPAIVNHTYTYPIPTPSGQVVSHSFRTSATSFIPQTCPTGATFNFKAFVSSEKYTGDLGGISGANAKCQSLASTAGLSGTYAAYIADETSAPATSTVWAFARSSSIKWRDVKGGSLINGWPDLTDRDAELLYDERGNRIQATEEAWTNVWGGGTLYMGSKNILETYWTNHVFEVGSINYNIDKFSLEALGIKKINTTAVVSPTDISYQNAHCENWGETRACRLSCSCRGYDSCVYTLQVKLHQYLRTARGVCTAYCFPSMSGWPELMRGLAEPISSAGWSNPQFKFCTEPKHLYCFQVKE